MRGSTVTATRRSVLETVADLVPESPVDCVRVGIDGADGVGKSTFGDDLADVLVASGRRVVRVSVDDFHHPRAVRQRRGKTSPEGFWLDSYDYAALRERVLEPLSPGGSRRYVPASHDLRSDAFVDPPPREASPGAVLVLDGLFLHRDELVGVWDVSVFLTAPFSCTLSRMAARDGTPADPDDPRVARYVRGQQLYFEACAPEQRATVVIDATDLDAPVLTRLPSG